VGKRYCELEKTHYWEEKTNHIQWKKPIIWMKDPNNVGKRYREMEKTHNWEEKDQSRVVENTQEKTKNKTKDYTW
jgi:hypothetical protein